MLRRETKRCQFLLDGIQLGSRVRSETDIDSSLTRTGDNLNVESDKDLVLFKSKTLHNITKDQAVMTFTNNRRFCPSYAFLVSLIFQFICEPCDIHV